MWCTVVCGKGWNSISPCGIVVVVVLLHRRLRCMCVDDCCWCVV